MEPDTTTPTHRLETRGEVSAVVVQVPGAESGQGMAVLHTDDPASVCVCLRMPGKGGGEEGEGGKEEATCDLQFAQREVLSQAKRLHNLGLVFIFN